jgi:hypothetical protein
LTAKSLAPLFRSILVSNPVRLTVRTGFSLRALGPARTCQRLTSVAPFQLV